MDSSESGLTRPIGRMDRLFRPEVTRKGIRPMRSTSRMPVWVSILAGMTAGGLLIVAGCTLDKPGNQPQGVFNRIGGHGGQLIEPRRCLIKVVILNRPFNDPAINEVVWRVADEQVISPKERHALEANGLRIGRIIGELPPELESILNDGGPRNPKVVPTNLLVESGDTQQLISISEAVEQVSLLVNRENRVSGKDYRDASGYFRVIPRHQGAHGVSVRLTPEIHHGPVQRTFPALPNTGGFAPQELSIRDAQQEEAIHELSVELMLEPGEVAVIGCRPEIQSSLGSFLFSESPTDNDQRHQKLIMIWASRNLTGMIGEPPKTSDRPKLFQRLIGPPPAELSPPDQTPKPAPAPDPGPAPTATKPTKPAKPAAKADGNPPSPDIAPPSSVPPPDTQAPPPLPK
jgi:hypothetical protein